MYTRRWWKQNINANQRPQAAETRVWPDPVENLPHTSSPCWWRTGLSDCSCYVDRRWDSNTSAHCPTGLPHKSWSGHPVTSRAQGWNAWGVPYVLHTSCLRQTWQATNALSASVSAATCLGTPDQGQRRGQCGRLWACGRLNRRMWLLHKTTISSISRRATDCCLRFPTWRCTNVYCDVAW